MINHVKRNYFFYTILLLLLISVAASTYRFLVIYDYQVTFEGECDPTTDSCFVYCEEESCNDPFYYSWITAPAKLIHEQCDDNVTECDFVYECVASNECKIEFCNSAITEECSALGNT